MRERAAAVPSSTPTRAVDVLLVVLQADETRPRLRIIEQAGELAEVAWRECGGVFTEPSVIVCLVFALCDCPLLCR